MKTIKNILTENREATIKELKEKFHFQNVQIGRLMADFLEYLEAGEDVNGDDEDCEYPAINWLETLNKASNVQHMINYAIELFHARYNYGADYRQMGEFDEQRRREIRNTI